jgi:hypothetical protein
VKALKLTGIAILGLVWLGSAAQGAIYLTAGDIGPSDPTVMLHEKEGLSMTRPESWVYSGGAIAYPEEFYEAVGLTITLYFIPATSSPGNVNFKVHIDSYNIGDQYNLGGFTNYSPVVPVGGSTVDVYAQEFNWGFVPDPADLFRVAVSRDIYGTAYDTYQGTVYLHAIKIQPHFPGDVNQPEVPQPRTLGLNVFPNPSNPAATVKFILPEAGAVTLNVFDVRGQLVATLIQDEFKEAGSHAVEFYPQNASGVYFAQIIAKGEVSTKKFTVVK